MNASGPFDGHPETAVERPATAAGEPVPADGWVLADERVMADESPLTTFRDPAGSLRLVGAAAVRTIQPAARDEVLGFLRSPLSERLVAQGAMVASAVEEDAAGLRLVHPRLAVPTYSWEWTPGQWLAAAELTLRLCEEALVATGGEAGEGPGGEAGAEAGGWILKDATPLNILFDGPRPVLVDVLSFERRDPTSAIWLAYGQYVRTFLLPLLVHKLLHWPLALTFFRRDGYEPAELYDALSWGQRLGGDALMPVTLPTILERRKERRRVLGETRETVRPSGPAKDPGLALHLLQRTLAGLKRRTRAALSKEARSHWSEYTATLTHYTAAESAQKTAWVQAALEELRPAWVMDVGANTGEFSRLAAASGARVIALERDAAAADRLYAMSRAEGLDILTIHADLARPTPAAGWANAEQTSLLARLRGKADLVLLLAVIHHLILMEQIPLDKIVALLQGLTRRYLVVEWVPVSDPMFQSLMRGREALYGSLGEADLLRACEGRFTLRRRQPLENGRVLLLLERQPAESAR